MNIPFSTKERRQCPRILLADVLIALTILCVPLIFVVPSGGWEVTVVVGGWSLGLIANILQGTL